VGPWRLRESRVGKRRERRAGQRIRRSVRPRRDGAPRTATVGSARRGCRRPKADRLILCKTPQPRHPGCALRHLRVRSRRSRGAGAGDDNQTQGHRLPGCAGQASSPPRPRLPRSAALMAHACEAGHEIPEASHKRGGPCSACRIAAVAAPVATADPTLDGDLITQAIDAVINSPATLRDLHAALAGGTVALIAGAPALRTPRAAPRTGSS
jgi:hypothetical protein